MRFSLRPILGLFGAGACVALVLSGCGSFLPSRSASSAPPPPVSTKGFPTGPHGSGIFTDRCTYSHEAADDPILMPGKTGQSMQHDFFGNTATNASSTAATLTGGSTTCTTGADASAYWIPVLYQNGQALRPLSALIYWRQSGDLAKSTSAMPAGMEMIAGNEQASSPQSKKVVRWTCSAKSAAGAAAAAVTATSTPHDCPTGSDLRLILTFPSCWNGHDLNGASQKNVVYPVMDRCPSGYQTAIPQIVFHVNYPTSSSAALTLSMSPTMQGSTDTAHADFINGWNEALMARNVQACIVAGLRCGPVTGAGAVPQGGKAR